MYVVNVFRLNGITHRDFFGRRGILVVDFLSVPADLIYSKILYEDRGRIDLQIQKMPMR